MTPVLAGLSTAMAIGGVLQALVASRMVTAFSKRPKLAPTMLRPAVTVLKPLHGPEPLLEDALATFCQQVYPQWQIVFGLNSPDDPAAIVVARLRERFPTCDIDLIIDPAHHGPNRKIGNLINMFPAARHDVLVIADSDIHVRTDYLDRLVAALAQPGVGLVTTLYAGLPARTNVTARLGAMQITHGFLPSAVMARSIGRQDCLGATMCLRRQDLARIGGFSALVEHLADDNVLGRQIIALGLKVALADTVPLTTVPENTFSELWRHELRWARTIRTLQPAGFAASVLQYSLTWALLTVTLTGGLYWSFGLLAAVWLLRASAARSIDRALMPEWKGDRHAAVVFCCPIGLLPVRDILSVTVMLASYAGRRVDWRGHTLHANTPRRPDTSFAGPRK